MKRAREHAIFFVINRHAFGVVNLQLATRRAWYAYTAARLMP